jgi:tetratricopeptide (TPR) repeat protein
MEDRYASILREMLAGNMPQPERVPAVEPVTAATTREERIANFNSAAAETRTMRDSYVWTSDFTNKTPSRPVTLDGLTPINIRDLRIGEVHRGRALFARILTEVTVMRSAMVLVEDENGEIIDLAVYGLESQSIGELTEGRCLAIAEPFYKVRNDGSKGIRVDNPADLFFDVDKSQLVIESERASKPAPQRVSLEARLQEMLLGDGAIGSKRLHKMLLEEGYSVSNKQVRALRATLKEGGAVAEADEKKLVPILSERRPEKDRVIYSPRALEHREEGNKAFKTGDFKSAEIHYSAALQHRDDSSEGKKTEGVHLWQLYGNRAAASLKQGKLVEALQDSLTANICSPKDEVKPVLRCAEALAALGLWNEAVDLLDETSSAFPESKAGLSKKKQVLAPKATIHVGPGNKFTSIAAALQAAPSNAEILVAPGVYREQVVIRKPVTIRCEEVSDETAAIRSIEGDQTTSWAEIKSAGMHSVIIHCPMPSPIRIIGCRICCNGDPRLSFHGVYIGAGVAVLRACSISSASGPCVAAENSDSRMIMQSCAVHDGAQGGVLAVNGAEMYLNQVHCCRNAASGLELRDQASANIEGCHFYSNGRQGITSWKSAGRLEAKHCSIHSNLKESGVLVSEANALLESCSLAGNGAAGIVAQQRGTVSILKCEVHDNNQGILIQDTGSARIENCDIHSNSANGIFVGFDHRGSAAIIKNSVHDNRSMGILLGNCGKVVTRENKEYNNHGLPPQMPTICSPEQVRLSSKYTNRLKKNKESIAKGLRATQANSFLDSFIRDSADQFTEMSVQAQERVRSECAFCRKLPSSDKDFRKCSRCKKVRYCSPTCQRSHWTQHKPNCQARPVKYPAFVDHQQPV